MKREKGITLVALIITIILLLILTSVIIKSIIDFNIIGLATKSAETYAKAQIEELDILNNIEKEISEIQYDIGGNLEIVLKGEMQEGYYISDVTVIIRATSASKVKYEIMGAEQINSINKLEAGEKISFVLMKDGSYKLVAYAMDNIENILDKSEEINFTKDATPPMASIELIEKTPNTISVIANR